MHNGPPRPSAAASALLRPAAGFMLVATRFAAQRLTKAVSRGPRTKWLQPTMATATTTAPTKLLYFDGTSEGEDKLAVVVTETIFYPFGGGQPNDTGVIESGGARFDVSDVRLKDGVVFHYGHFASGSADAFAPGTSVSLAIDEARRRLHARVHSAGHLLDVCMARIGLGPEKLVPAKGQHYADVAYVEYKGKISAEEQASLQEKLQKEIDAAVAAGSKARPDPCWVSAAIVPYSEAASLCGGDLPPYIAKDSTPRVVVMVDGTTGCPCGGTHVADVGEIGAMKITGVRVKKGVTRVSYVIDGMTAPADGAAGAD